MSDLLAHENSSAKNSTKRGRRALWLAVGAAVIWLVIGSWAGPLAGSLSEVQENDAAKNLAEDSRDARTNGDADSDVVSFWLLLLFIATFFGIAAEEARRPSMFQSSAISAGHSAPNPIAYSLDGAPLPKGAGDERATARRRTVQQQQDVVGRAQPSELRGEHAKHARAIAPRAQRQQTPHRRDIDADPAEEYGVRAFRNASQRTQVTKFETAHAIVRQ
jgi:hypothetical protein